MVAELMKEGNVRGHRVKEMAVVERGVAKISKNEMRKALKRMRRGKAAYLWRHGGD